jgi:hypothetical protein
MTPGILIIMYFLAIPFMFEMDVLSRRTGGYPKFWDVLKLKSCFSSRWIYSYAILVLLFVSIELAPSASGKDHRVSAGMVAVVLGVQGVIWGGIFYENLKRRRNSKNGE